MLKTKLLTTASAVVVACGALSLGAITTAQAGELKVKLTDVNIKCNEYEVETQHYDRDCYEVDVNGNTGPNTGPFNTRSIDKGFISIVKPEGTFNHVAIADEREINANTPSSGLWEVDLFEIEAGSTFTKTILVEIELSGDSDPWFKENQNCVDVLRAGSDNVFSAAAFKPSPADDADGGIQVDKNRAVCFVQTTQNNDVAPDSSIGFALPIKTKNCGDLVINMTVTRFVEGIGAVGTESTSHLFQECRDSLHSYSGYYPTKIDYFYNFRTFLVDPDPHDDVEYHEYSLWADTGALQFDIWHNLTDLKYDFGKNKGAEENVFDVTDIDSYHLEVTFKDLTGIESFELGGMPAYLDRVNNVAYWDLSEQEFADKFCLGDDNVKGANDEGCTKKFTIHAFGENYDGPYAGPIDHQDLVITKSRIYFDDYETNGIHPAPFLAYEDEQVGALVGHLVKTGIIFGAFDWVADNTRQVRSFFRLTGIPDTYVGDLKGHVTVENASAGHEFNGDYKVDFTPYVNDSWEMMLTPANLNQLFEDAGMPGAADFGRADLTFTFYVPGREGIKMDMDRLLFTNGVYTSYGDNGNDAFSLKARSCDDGRFGSHVANKLDPNFKHLLVGICSIGELSRNPD